jgi:hypothetical protein
MRSGRNVLHITLLLSGAVKYPAMAMALFTILGQNKIQPGDVINVRCALRRRCALAVAWTLHGDPCMC